MTTIIIWIIVLAIWIWRCVPKRDPDRCPAALAKVPATISQLEVGDALKERTVDLGVRLQWIALRRAACFARSAAGCMNSLHGTQLVTVSWEENMNLIVTLSAAMLAFSPIAMAQGYDANRTGQSMDQMGQRATPTHLLAPRSPAARETRQAKTACHPAILLALIAQTLQIRAAQTLCKGLATGRRLRHTGPALNSNLGEVGLFTQGRIALEERAQSPEASI